MENKDRFTNNSIRTYTLSGSALIDLNAWDRVYCISTSACDTITPWNVAIKWPSTYQFTWLWYYAWSKMFIRKVSRITVRVTVSIISKLIVDIEWNSSTTIKTHGISFFWGSSSEELWTC